MTGKAWVALAIAGPTALLVAGLVYGVAHRRYGVAVGCVAGLAAIYLGLPALAAWEGVTLRGVRL